MNSWIYQKSFMAEISDSILQKKQVAELLGNAVEYEEEIRDRVASILYLQMDKYRYLWK